MNKPESFIGAKDFTTSILGQQKLPDTLENRPVYTPDEKKTVARGTWVNANKAARDIRIVRRNKKYAYSEISNEVDKSQYEVGIFYYLQVNSSPQRGWYDDFGYCCDTF